MKTLALLLCGLVLPCAGQTRLTPKPAPAQTAAELQAKDDAASEQRRQAVLAKFAANPAEAKLRPVFIADARAALKAVDLITPTAEGLAGVAFADRKQEAIHFEGLNLAEYIVKLALDGFELGVQIDRFAAAPAGPMPAVSPVQIAREKACYAAIRSILDAGEGQPSIPECEPRNFAIRR